MPVHRDANGNRYVEAETHVPGTPEQVWDAIATGPGISSWFVPSEVEGRVGGAVRCNFGPGMESLSTITAWEPPHRFTADSRDDMGPDDPTVGTEWIVEAQSGGTCTVRVVHRWFTSSDAWDDQFEGHSYGWLSFFRVLRSYLGSFAGQTASAFQVMAGTPESKEAGWAALVQHLGLEGVAIDQRVQAPLGEAPMSGTVEFAGQPMWPEELLIRLDAPAPGIVHIVAHPMGEQVLFTVRAYLFGPQAAAAAARAEPAWQAWLDQRFAFQVSP